MSPLCSVKSKSVVWLSIVSLLLLVLVGTMGLPAFAQGSGPDKELGEGSITFPPAILKDYSIVAAQSVVFAGLDENCLVVGYAPKEFSMEDPKPSFVAIYKETENGFDLVYRYLPVAPSDYPMPLTFEKMWAVTTWDDAGQQVTSALVTAWGETGADYWGTHPIVLAYADNGFTAVPLYQGNLAEDERIKGFTWTSPDIQVGNFFDPSNEVTTILTQGVDVDQGKVVLTFWADDECKACEHELVNIELDVSE